MGDNLPVILIELVLVFGGVLGFAWWQLRSVARDRREAGQKKAIQQAAQTAAQNATPTGSVHTGTADPASSRDAPSATVTAARPPPTP